MPKDPLELTQAVQYWSTLIQPPEFLNTRVEGLFLQRQTEMKALSLARQKLCDTEYLLALQCCPFYLAQRLWYDDAVNPRIRTFVCDIQFQSNSPYYVFHMYPETARNKSSSRRIKGNLKYVSGVQNTFVEELSTYEERIRLLSARGLVTLRPKYSSMDTVEIVHHCAVSSRSNALVNLDPADTEWFDKIFELNHHKK
jgi:hypothetical protein